MNSSGRSCVNLAAIESIRLASFGEVLHMVENRSVLEMTEVGLGDAAPSMAMSAKTLEMLQQTSKRKVEEEGNM